MLGVIGVAIGLCWLAAGGVVAPGFYNSARGRNARAERERFRDGALAALALTGSLIVVVAGRL